MAVAMETLAIALGGEEHAFPILSFLDRRGRKDQRKQWVLVRAVERLLYGVTEGARSTGRFALHLGKCSMADSVLVCDKAAIEDETITQDEFDAGTLPSPNGPTTLLTAVVCALDSDCGNEDAGGAGSPWSRAQGLGCPHHAVLQRPLRVWAHGCDHCHHEGAE